MKKTDTNNKPEGLTKIVFQEGTARREDTGQEINVIPVAMPFIVRFRSVSSINGDFSQAWLEKPLGKGRYCASKEELKAIEEQVLQKRGLQGANAYSISEPISTGCTGRYLEFWDAVAVAFYRTM